jgi:hypothetical protein
MQLPLLYGVGLWGRHRSDVASYWHHQCHLHYLHGDIYHRHCHHHCHAGRGQNDRHHCLCHLADALALRLG